MEKMKHEIYEEEKFKNKTEGFCVICMNEFEENNEVCILPCNDLLFLFNY